MKNITLLVFSFFLTTIAFAEKKIVDSKITEVTVYPLGAMIYREVDLNIQKGESFIVLDNLTSIIDANTIQVGGAGDFDIVSVKFEMFYPFKSIRPEGISVIEDSLKMLDDKVFLLTAENKALDEERFMILTSKSLMGDQGPILEDVNAMANYYRTRFADISKEKLRNRNEKNHLTQEKERLTATLSGMNRYQYKQVGRILIEVRTTTLVKATIKFSYFTSSASWSPKYNIKASSGVQFLDVDYHAMVAQNTGVDWDEVDLILSTSTPSLNNQKPVLHPWYLDYYNEFAVRNYTNKLIDKGNTSVAYTGEHIDNMTVRSATAVAANTAGVYAAENGSGTLNIRGARAESNYYYIDGMKVMGSTNLPKSAINETRWDAYGNYNYQKSEPKYSSGELVFNALNLSYKIESKYTVKSNNTSKQVYIKNAEIPSTFGHYAVPSLEEEAFLTAEIVDWASYDLIPGNATLFYNKTYVGKSFILSNAVDDTLRISLGRDKGVSLKRESVKELLIVKKVGSNMKKNFVYETTIRNNNKGDIEVIVYDRIPVSRRSGIIVSMGKYVGAKYNKETGILKWTKTIPAGGKVTVQFDYEVKYPKDKVINL